MALWTCSECNDNRYGWSASKALLQTQIGMCFSMFLPWRQWNFATKKSWTSTFQSAGNCWVAQNWVSIAAHPINFRLLNIQQNHILRSYMVHMVHQILDLLKGFPKNSKNIHYRFPSHGGCSIGKIKNHLKQTQEITRWFFILVY